MHAIPGDRMYFCVLYEWLVRWHLRAVESHRTDEAVRFFFFSIHLVWRFSSFFVSVAAPSCSGILCWMLITKMYAHGLTRSYFKIHLITSFRLHTRLQNKRHFSRLRRAITAHIHCSYIRSIVFNCVSCLFVLYFSLSFSLFIRMKPYESKCTNCALFIGCESAYRKSIFFFVCGLAFSENAKIGYLKWTGIQIKSNSIWTKFQMKRPKLVRAFDYS